MASSTAGGQTPAPENPDLEGNVGGTSQQDTQVAIDRFLGSFDPDTGEAQISPVGGRPEGPLHLPTDEVGPREERDSSPARCTGLTFLGAAHTAENADASPERSIDQEVPCTSTKPSDPEGCLSGRTQRTPQWSFHGE